MSVLDFGRKVVAEAKRQEIARRLRNVASLFAVLWALSRKR